jgi:hypothetical protein
MNYNSFSEDNLIETYFSMIDSGEVSNEILKEIELRNSIESFKEKIDQLESDRILKEIIHYIKDGEDYYFIKENIHSQIWEKQKLNQFIENKFQQQRGKKFDKTIYSTTISGSIHGFIIGSIIGSVIWASSIFFLKEMKLPLLVINFYVAYLFTKLLTGQSKNNYFVFVACMLATVVSFFGGLYILELLHI